MKLGERFEWIKARYPSCLWTNLPDFWVTLEPRPNPENLKWVFDGANNDVSGSVRPDDLDLLS